MRGVTSTSQNESLPDPGRARRNRSLLLSEVILWTLASGLLDARTLLPAFVSRYSASLILIALVTAIRSGGNLLPQLFAAHLMRKHARKKPWLLVGALLRALPILAIALVLFVQPHASATVVLSVFFPSLVLFSVANSFASLSWWDIVGKTIPGAQRPGLLGSMMLGGSVMGFATGALVKALFDSPRWPFPRNYALLFALAFAALTVGLALLAGLFEPADNTLTTDASQPGSLAQLRRLIGDGGPFTRLLRVQLLLGLPALAAGLYMPYALNALRLPLDVTGIFVAATAAGAGLGGLCLPLVARRDSSRAVLEVVAVSAILAPVIVAIAGWLPAGVWLREGCCALSFACQGWAATGLFVGLNDLVLAMAPADERPLYMGLSNTIAGLLGLLPLVGGVLAQWVGTAAVLWLCPLPVVAGIVALRGMRASAEPSVAESAVLTDKTLTPQAATGRQHGPSHWDEPG